jgi:hypothetical protein
MATENGTDNVARNRDFLINEMIGENLNKFIIKERGSL